MLTAKKENAHLWRQNFRILLQYFKVHPLKDEYNSNPTGFSLSEGTKLDNPFGWWACLEKKSWDAMVCGNDLED